MSQPPDAPRDAHSSDPDALSSDPDAHSSDPDALSSDPDALSSDPDALSSDPDAPAVTRIGFVLPRPAYPSGGHHYNAAVLRHWPAGVPAPEVVELDGRWPEGDDRSRRALANALARFDLVIVDGLVGAAQPELIETGQRSASGAAGGRSTRIVLLIHLPLADAGGLDEAVAARLEDAEGRSVRAAWRVLATSATAAADVARRHGRPDVGVVQPGVDAAPLGGEGDPARPSTQSPLGPLVAAGVPHLLSVGALCDRKNQLTLARALSSCEDLPWTASIVGPPVEPAYVERLRAALPRRVRLRGALTGSELAAEWGRAALMLHPARAETWGMVVTEALAHGIPVIVGRGTGAEEALRSGCVVPGASVDPDDPDELAALLRRWLTDATLRADWLSRAAAARQRLRGWPEAAREFAEACGAELGRSESPAEPHGRGGGRQPLTAPIAADWLALRRPADETARAASEPLLHALRDALPPGRLTVVDLGAGTGANQAWLGPRLGRESRWVLVDHDATLLAASDNSVGTRVLGGIAEAADALEGSTGARLLTCSALLDLLSAAELDRIAEILADHQIPGLFALSVDGTVALDPFDPADSLVAEAFNAHQRRLERPGPDAPAVLGRACEARGLHVIRAATPWVLDGDGPELLCRLLAERAAAATAERPEANQEIARWLTSRLTQVRENALTVRVGHLDLLVLPRAAEAAVGEPG